MSQQSAPIDPHADQPVLIDGAPLAEAVGAVVLMHGRGASAEDILGLGRTIAAPGLALLAPQAAGHTWYPYSFLVPTAQNQPYLASALAKIGAIVASLEAAGIPAERIALAGFSQGACLASEFAARNAKRYGAVLAYSGGLIGGDDEQRDYAGSLAGTPVFMGCSDVDPHIPLPRLNMSQRVLSSLGGAVDFRIYPGMGHTINQDELRAGQLLLANLAGITPGS